MSEHLSTSTQRLRSRIPTMQDRLTVKDLEYLPAPSAPHTSHDKVRPSIVMKITRYISAIFGLGRTYARAKQAYSIVKQQDRKIHEFEAKVTADIAATTENFERRLDYLRSRIAETDRLIAYLSSQRQAPVVTTPPAQPQQNHGTDAAPETAYRDRQFEDIFYHRFENRYRGTVVEIKTRLETYIPDVKNAVMRTEGKAALDLGCGRGEWLSLMAQHDIKAFGVDTNPVQVDEAKRAGLDIQIGDALQILASQADNSLSVISAHHLIEHLSFSQVAWIVREAIRALAPGGLLILETPNIRNIVVGASTFHTDPTHKKPMPDQLMEPLLESAGYDPIEIRHLHPHERFNELMAQPDIDNELVVLVFGPRDLAILGQKPAEK